MKQVAAAVVVASVVGLSGCHAGGSSTLGAGDPIDACDGVTELNGLPEPDIASRPAILDYTAGALRVIDRIDTDRKVHTISDTKVSVPSSVITALKAQTAAYEKLRTQITAATTAPKLHAVVQAFTNSSGFAGADSTVELWAGNQCG